MYPTLLRIGSFRLDTYSVIWFIALSLAIIWTVHRLEKYSLDEYEARRVLAVSFFFMIIGAKSFEYIIHWNAYMNNPALFLDINRGGVHEFGAVAGAFLSALFMCCVYPRRVSFSRLCDAASPPAILAIAIGRWGCFLNGCCVGIGSRFFTAVHFPFDKPGVFRHPVQIYYSVTAFVIVVILLWAERRVLPVQRRQKKHYSVIAPLAVILYSLMRIVFIPVREYSPFMRVITYWLTYRGIITELPFMFAWLSYSLLKLKSHSQDK